jgi:iron complex outermembrane receptor protein
VVDALPQTQVFGQYTYAVAPVATILLISQGNADFELTTGTSVEAGLKTTLADGRVDATAAVFTIEQDDTSPATGTTSTSRFREESRRQRASSSRSRPNGCAVFVCTARPRFSMRDSYPA